MQMQQRQMEAANIAQELEIRKANAEAVEAERRAEQAHWQAQKAMAEAQMALNPQPMMAPQ